MIFGEQYRESNAKLLVQLLSASPNHCCYFTLLNEMLALQRLNGPFARRQLWPSDLPDFNSVGDSM